MRRLAVWLVLSMLVAGCARPARPAPPVGTQSEGAKLANRAPAVAESADPVVQTPPPPSPPAPPEPPKAAIEPAQVLQGAFAVLQMDRAVSGNVKVQVQGLAEQPRVFLRGDRALAFIGFPANAQVGVYPVTATWTGGSWKGSVTVVKKRFTEDRLTVTRDLTDIYYDPRQDEEWRRLFAVRSNSEPRPLWRGAFQPPLAGKLEITTHFGEIRYVNGVETGRHSGMDFGADTGTPVLAPAPGRVVLAERLIVTGWTIIIDHGYNLYTTYYHCDRVTVAPGDWVEPGQRIGTVGSTGFSTGPHLHWTATIGNTPVNPWPLTQAPPLGVVQWSLKPPPGIEE